jgi:ribokinase
MPEALQVVVVGSLNMDLVVRVAHLPRAGETVVGDDLLRAPGGKGANQAVAAARLGASVSLVGRVGRDGFGHELTAALRDAGVSTRWVLGSDRPTGAALIEVDAAGENSIAVAPGANQEVLPEDIPARLVGDAEVVVAPLEVPLATIEEAFRLARAASRRTVLNVAPARPVPASLLRLADVVVANEVEAATLLGRDALKPDNEAEAARALRTFAEQVVVVTLGARGAVAVFEEQVVWQESFAVDVMDTVGAGDAFVAGFVVGRWWSAGVAAALRLGCAAGALACTRGGAQPALPSLAEVEALLARPSA